MEAEGRFPTITVANIKDYKVCKNKKYFLFIGGRLHLKSKNKTKCGLNKGKAIEVKMDYYPNKIVSCKKCLKTIER